MLRITSRRFDLEVRPLTSAELLCASVEHVKLDHRSVAAIHNRAVIFLQDAKTFLSAIPHQDRTVRPLSSDEYYL
jgi:hypothetical protein